jgi:signal transduction histidine kinase
MTADHRLIRREVLLVAAAALVQVGGTLLASTNQPEHGTPPAGGIALLLIGVAAIPLRLWSPVAALLVATAATFTYTALDYAGGPYYVGLIITFGCVVLAGHRLVAIAVLVAHYIAVLWVAPALGRTDTPTLPVALALAAWLIVLYTACELIRARVERGRAAAQAKADAMQRRVANERLAIARELHDVVAHNMSLINLQAGVALHVDDGLPDSAREALQTIKSASKEALVELRSILGVLRHADEGEGAPRAPAPGLAAMADLVSRSAVAGVDVTLDVDPDLGDLPRAVDLAAYRIVQESLTNVARHADPPVATVSLHRSNGTLVVSVVDDGTGHRRGEPLPSGGNGLPGMRERAASVGGTLAAGPRLAGGFAVEARLPLGTP